MSKKYKIEITLSPDISNYLYKPYFWVLFSNNGKNWCNEASGWAVSPEDAWTKAYNFYLTYKK